MEGSCWHGQRTFDKCCYSPANSCFESAAKFERCCVQNVRIARNDIFKFAYEWTPFTSFAIAFARDGVCQRKRKQMFSVATDTPKRFSKFVRAISRFFHLSSQESCRSRQHRGPSFEGGDSICQARLGFWKSALHLIREKLNNPENLTLDAATEVSVDVVAAAHIADFAVLEAVGGFRGRVGCMPAQEAKLYTLIKSVWGQVRSYLIRDRLADFGPCSCAGQGYDMHMLAKRLMKLVSPSQKTFPSIFVDPSSRAHHYISAQRCVNQAGPQELIYNFPRGVNSFSCPSGDAAIYLIMLHRCLQEGKWRYAVAYLFQMLALVIRCPIRNSFETQMWNFSADDILYNFARVVGGVGLETNSDASGNYLDEPLSALKSFAWHRSPLRIFDKVADVQSQTLQFNGQICVAGGRIALPVGAEVDTNVCTEFGCMPPPVTWIFPDDWSALISQSPLMPAGHILLVFQIGSKYFNIWHGLHWMVPALSMKRARRWKRNQLHLAISFESYPILPNNLELCSSVLAVMSQHAPYVLDPSFAGKSACFQQAVLGIPSFKYDLQLPKTTKADLVRFRQEMTGAFPARYSTDLASDIWKSASDGPLRVLIVQRAKGSRWIANMPDVLRELSRIPFLDVSAQNLEFMPLFSQAALLNKTDVLVGAHGAGLAWMAMMPPGSAVVEVTPIGMSRFIPCTGVWDDTASEDTLYGGLAKVCGHRYACIDSDATAPEVPRTLDLRYTLFVDYREAILDVPVGLLVYLLTALSDQYSRHTWP